MSEAAARHRSVARHPTKRGVLCLAHLRRSAGMTILLASLVRCPVAAQSGASNQERLLLDAARAWITNSELEAHTRFLASDPLMGRAPGTQGGLVTAQYIASQFERIGLEPGGNEGTYFQRVPLMGLTPHPVVLVGNGATAMALSYPDDFVAKPERPDRFLVSGGNVVFVGYGIQAPELDWDDFKDLDISGRVLLMLPNDPGYADPDIFDGARPTPYGDLGYKLEQAESLGAAGVFFVHSESALVPWEVIRNRWNREIVLPIQEGGEGQLDFTGWMSQAAAEKIASSSGFDWNVLQRRASLREFRPAELDYHLAIDIASETRTFEASNVVGMIRGNEFPERSVIVTAHHDYLGVARGTRMDSIFNGARATAANVAALITMAGAYTAAGISTPATLRFVASTAGESGGLGIESFLWSLAARHESPQAAIVFEEANLWGPTADISVWGDDSIETDPVIQRAANLEGLLPVPAEPKFNVIHLGDALGALGAARVPYAAIGAGRRLPGGAPSARDLAIDAYYERHFSRTSDNMLSDFDFDGLRSQIRFAVVLAWELANLPATTSN